MKRIVIQKVTFGSPEQKQSIELRRRVLRVPLGLDFSEEELNSESNQIHFVAQQGAKTVGVLLLVPQDSGILKMRQVAVEPSMQRQGVGNALVAEAELWASQNGFHFLVLHARDSAVPFYKNLGYLEEGPKFLEVGIPHLRMIKRIGIVSL